MADVDIVARLQLNAQQFSSEAGQQFASFATKAGAAAAAMRQPFVSAFSEVQKLAQQSLTLPRTTGGSLDLSAQIASLQVSAKEAEQAAIAQRELSTAMYAASESGRADAEGLRAQADAAAAASLASEREAEQTRSRISTLQAVQVELAKTASATDVSVAANDNEVRATNRNYAAKAELMHVVRSVGDSYAAGIPLQQIFAMEAGRIAEAFELYSAQGAKAATVTKAVSDGAEAAVPAIEAEGAAAAETGAAVGAMGEAGAAAGGALTGMLVPALGIAFAVLAPFVSKVLEGNDAVAKQVEQLKADAAQTEVTRKAKELFGNSLDGVIAAINEQAHALDDARKQEASAAQQAYNLAAANDAKALSYRRTTQALLEQAIAQATANRQAAAAEQQYGTHDAAGFRQPVLDANVDGLQQQLARVSASLATAQSNLSRAHAGLVAETAATLADPIESITAKYKKARQAIIDNAAATKDWAGEQAKLVALDKQEEAAKEAARKAEHPKAPRSGYKGEGDDLAIANAQAKVAEATTDVQRAEAELEVTRAEAKKQLDAHSISLATYTARVNGAALAVKAAKEAEADKKAVVEWGAKYADPALFVEAKKAPSLGDGGFDQDFQRQDNQRKQDAIEAEQSMHHLADLYGDLFAGNTRNIWSDFEKQGADAMSAILAQQSKAMFAKLPPGVQKFINGDVAPGMAYGELGGSVFSSITGGKQDPIASGLGGVIGKKAGEAMAKPIGDIFGKTIGGFAGPLGGVLGGVLGNVIGGLFSSPKWSNSQIGLNAYGSATGQTGTGNGSSAIQAATGESSSVAAAVNQIAQQLGAKITGLPAMTLGTFNGNYRVATVSTTAALNYNNFGHDVLQDFGQDQQGAIEYAARYAISHAVITGISEASKKIIADGSEDLQSALTKALMIESVPKDLKAMLDPVGAAIDALNLKWQQTVDALKEGGASAEQMAQAQELYKLQLDKTKSSTSAADQALKDFLTSLKIGSDSPYSLRDQEAAAKAALQPFLDEIKAGQSIDQDKFQTAAKSYLDVERSMYGSTQGYFDAQDLVQSAVNQAISTIDNATPITTAVADPFAEATASSTASTADNTATGNDLLSQVSGTLSNVQSLLSTIAANTTAGGGSSFIGAGRSFVQAA